MRRNLLLLFIIPVLLFAGSAYAQGVIEGVVKDGDGVAVVGATVAIKGTAINTITDVNGLFSIKAQEFPFSLQIRLVGFKAQDIEIYELSEEPLEITLIDDSLLETVVVTSRRREETAQNVPIPISVVSGAAIQQAGAFNVNRVKELIPSVQLYSSNPRNTGINIRGVGSPFGLTNDGLDPGVGFYVDGVYYARPGSSHIRFY